MSLAHIPPSDPQCSLHSFHAPPPVHDQETSRRGESLQGNGTYFLSSSRAISFLTSLYSSAIWQCCLNTCMDSTESWQGGRGFINKNRKKSVHFFASEYIINDFALLMFFRERFFLHENSISSHYWTGPGWFCSTENREVGWYPPHSSSSVVLGQSQAWARAGRLMTCLLFAMRWSKNRSSNNSVLLPRNLKFCFREGQWWENSSAVCFNYPFLSVPGPQRHTPIL